MQLQLLQGQVLQKRIFDLQKLNSILKGNQPVQRQNVPGLQVVPLQYPALYSVLVLKSGPWHFVPQHSVLTVELKRSAVSVQAFFRMMMKELKKR